MEEEAFRHEEGDRKKEEGGNRFFIEFRSVKRHAASRASMPSEGERSSPSSTVESPTSCSRIPYGSLSAARKASTSPPPSRSPFLSSASSSRVQEAEETETVRWAAAPQPPAAAPHPVRSPLERHQRRPRRAEVPPPPPHGALLAASASDTVRKMPPFLSVWLAAAGLSIAMEWERGVFYREYLAQPFSSVRCQRWRRACATSHRLLQHLLPELAMFPMNGGAEGVAAVDPESRRESVPPPSSSPGVFSRSKRCDRPWRTVKKEKETQKEKEKDDEEEANGAPHPTSTPSKEKWCPRATSPLSACRSSSSLAPPSPWLRPEKRVAQENRSRAKLLARLQAPSHWRRVWGEVPTQTVARAVNGRFVLPSPLQIDALTASLKLFRHRGFLLREVLLKYLGLDHIGTPEEEMESSVEEEDGSASQCSRRRRRGSGGGEKEERSRAERCRQMPTRGRLEEETQASSASSFRKGHEKDEIDGEGGHGRSRKEKGSGEERYVVDDDEGNASLVVVENPTIAPPQSARDVLLDVQLDIPTGLLRVRLQVLLTTDTQEVRFIPVASHLDRTDDSVTRDTKDTHHPPPSSVASPVERPVQRSPHEEKGVGHRSPPRGVDIAAASSSWTSSSLPSPASGSACEDESPNPALRPVVVSKRVQKTVDLGTWSAASLGVSMRWVVLEGPLQHQILFFDTQPCRSGGVAGKGSANRMDLMSSAVGRRAPHVPPRPFCPTSSSVVLPTHANATHVSASSSPSRQTSAMASMVMLGKDGVCFPRLHPSDAQATHFLCHGCGQWFCVQQKPPSVFSILPSLAPRGSFSSSAGVRGGKSGGLAPDSSSLLKEVPHTCATGHRTASILLPVSASFLQAADEFFQSVQRREAMYHTSMSTIPRGSDAWRPRGKKKKKEAPTQGIPPSEATESLRVRSLLDPNARNHHFGSRRHRWEDTPAEDTSPGEEWPPSPLSSSPPPPCSVALPMTKKKASGTADVLFHYISESQRIARAKCIRREVKEFVNAHRVETEWHPLWGRMLDRSAW